MSRHPNDWYIQAIQEGDDAKLQIIFDEFLPVIEHFVRANSGSLEDAKDVFMDALTVLYIKGTKNKLVLTSSFSTFLFAICKNHWLNKLRKKKIEARVINKHPPLSNLEDELNSLMMETERKRVLQENFSKLPPSCQRILDLSWHSDHNMEEIAKMLGWSYNYACKRKSNCIEKLTAFIKGDERYNTLVFSENPAKKVSDERD